MGCRLHPAWAPESCRAASHVSRLFVKFCSVPGTPADRHMSDEDLNTNHLAYPLIKTLREAAEVLPIRDCKSVLWAYLCIFCSPVPVHPDLWHVVYMRDHVGLRYSALQRHSTSHLPSPT